ncbi:MAG: amino acid racemase [Candidatus Woesearchaeota archaeon]
MTNKKPIIGVLGGVGPEATAEFYKRLILKMQEGRIVKQNTDYPQIIINSIPGEELFRENVDLEPYFDGLKELEDIGADFIVIVCNTAHYFFNRFQERVDTPLLDLREEVKGYLNRKKIKSVTVLGSHITINSNLFNLEIPQNNPNKQEINFLDSIIESYLARGEKKNIARFNKLVEKYSRKSDVILSACTELSLLLRETNISFVDTMDILIDSTIKFWKGK